MADKDFDNKAYWKKRLDERTISALRSLDILFQDIPKTLKSNGLETKEAQEQIDKIYNGFGELLSEIGKAKEIKEEHVKKQEKKE